MINTKKINLTKKDISKLINLKTGLPNFYSSKIIDDLIVILKSLIKKKEINIKNFATFKVIKKKERVGRNPKNNRIYKINSMNSLTFVISKKIKDEIRNL